MLKPRTSCRNCDGQILSRTAERNHGLCAVCLHKENIERGIEAEYVERDGQKYKVVPPDPVELDLEIDLSGIQSEHSVNWKYVEDALFSIAADYIQVFSTFHRGKEFYGIAFDCNADNAEVFLCANTKAALSSEAESYRKRSPKLYGRKKIAELEEQLRWTLGDWEFQALTTEGFSVAWTPFKEILCDMIPWGEDEGRGVDEFRSHFMETTCRCMLRLESEGMLNSLARTSDFETFVADHDESLNDSWSRYREIRSRDKR